VAQYLELLNREPLEIFQHSLRSLSNYPRECIAIYLGLEMGAMSQSFSDWSNSLYKEFRKWLKTGKTQTEIRETPKPQKTKRQVSESPHLELPPIKPKRQKSNSTTAKKSSRRPKK